VVGQDDPVARRVRPRAREGVEPIVVQCLPMSAAALVGAACSSARLQASGQAQSAAQGRRSVAMHHEQADIPPAMRLEARTAMRSTNFFTNRARNRTGAEVAVWL
jgi:hypothetical protein